MRPTRSPGVELTRHFLTSMFDGEWSAGRGQWKTVLLGLVVAALPAGLLSEMPSVTKFRAATISDQLALQVILAAITGIAALLVWQSLFPGRRDYLALAGLPVRARQVFGARLASVAIFAVGLTVALNLPATLIRSVKYSDLGPQVAASGLACLFVFFAIVSLQGLLLNALPARFFVRVSVYVQGVLFAGCVFSILQAWSIKGWTAAKIARLPDFAWAPPVWFTGLYERLRGDDSPFLSAMADRAFTGVAVTVAVSVLTYWLAYHRYRRLILEAPERVAPPRFRWNPVVLFARDPRQRGLISFMAATMGRSRTHRTIWLAYVGFALAVLLNSSLVSGALLVHNRRPYFDAIQFLVLFWPLACSAILLPGFKHVMRIPVELTANWAFRLNESHSRRDWMVAFERFVLAYALGPLYGLTIPLAFVTLPWEVALRMVILQVLLTLIVFESLFYGWQQLPFTCSYLPGQRTAVNIVSTYAVVLVVVVPWVAVIVAAASRFLPIFLTLGTLFLGAWLKIRMARRAEVAGTPLLYHETQAMPDLGIRGISPRTPSSDPPWPPPQPHPAPSSEPCR